MSWKDQFPKENRYFETKQGILYCGDCFKIMGEFPENIIDLVLTDPPYNMTENKWDTAINLELLWKILKKVRKDETAMVFTALPPFDKKLAMSNISEYKYDWVWKKCRIVNFLNAKKMPLRNVEYALVFYKKLPIYNPQFTKGKFYKKVSRKNVMTSPTYGGIKRNTTLNDKRYPTTLIEKSLGVSSNFKPKSHPTEKPVGLMEYFIKTYSNEGQIVLDPFLGSGTTAIASERLNRR